MASCTRDQYPSERRFSLSEALHITRGAAAAISHLHAKGILHGDLYGHNLLVNPDGDCLLSDFGAASFFAPDSALGAALQRIEARAFGCLLEELLQRCTADELQPLWQLQRRCVSTNLDERPDFADILDQLGV